MKQKQPPLQETPPQPPTTGNSRIRIWANKLASRVHYLVLFQMVISFVNSTARPDLFCVICLIGLYGIIEKDRKALLTFVFFMFYTIALDGLWIQ
jgi:hypothetical protein